MGEGGEEGEGRQGGRLARLHHRQEHREEGVVLGLLETGVKESFPIDVQSQYKNIQPITKKEYV